MAAARDDAPKAPPVIERFVRQLVIANKAVALYPPSSAIPRDTAEECLLALRDALSAHPEVRLVIDKRGLFHEGVPIFPDQSAFSSFAHELYLRKLAEVRFHAGIEASDIIALLSILKFTPEELADSGGFESRLWEEGVGTITVTDVQVTLVDAEATGATEPGVAGGAVQPELPLLSRREMDDTLASAYGGRQRDQIVIARIIGDVQAVRDYIQDTYNGGSDGTPDLISAGERFSELAQIVHEMGSKDQRELFRSLAAALGELDPQLQRDLLVEEVLPESRTSEGLAAVVRELDLEDVCRMLVSGLANGETSRDALVRAVRNLAMISLAGREKILTAAGAAMFDAGMSEAEISEVIELASPTQLSVRGAPVGSRAARPVDTVLQLLSIAPSVAMPDDDRLEGLAEIREEARVGITDGDVINALVSIVGLDTREAQFASTMSTLEDALSVLVDRGEIEVAADAAAQMCETAENPALSPEQRTRVRQAIGRFSRPGDIRALARTLQLYPPDSPEHNAASRLLDTLGPLAIAPLLEQLAEEPSMSARKALVDLLSGMAGDYIQEFGAYVTDPRWYFVRNVVTILGSTKSSASLLYLERTLRHSDPRVRRETIRGLFGINDRLAAEMLVPSLGDDDAQNVQLAARYLGASGARGAIPALELVARGEGRGNRDNGPRVEAIEALGRLGATEALPTLESLAGKRRTLIGAAKTRELKTAAESAIGAIRAGERAR